MEDAAEWLVERIVDKVMEDRMKMHDKLSENPTFKRLFGNIDMSKGVERERLMIRGRVKRILRYALELGVKIPDATQ